MRLITRLALIPLTLGLLLLGYYFVRAGAADEVPDTARIGPVESGGLRSEPFDLTLTAEPEGATIRYTLDGRTPSARWGLPYDGPIRIESTTVLRAIAFAPGESPRAGGGASEVVTRTFVFPAAVAEQASAPRGYPTRFESVRKRRTLRFDYAMDPDVLERPGAPPLGEVLAELPTLALALDPREFAALYSNHRARGRNTERRVSIELWYPKGVARYEGFEGFQLDAGLRMQGGLAVDQARKKSFRLFFRKEYGAGRLRYPVFESAVHGGARATDSFDTLVLRAGGNTNWSKEDAYKHEPSTYLRDQWVRDSALAMGGPSAHGIFAHVYVNGLYFGVFNLTERPDTRFLAEYLGGSEKDWFSTNHGDSTRGESDAWTRLDRLTRSRGVSELVSYDDLQKLVDVRGFSDYILLNWYCGVGDWPYNNWYAGARSSPPGPIRFIPWDAELAFWPYEYHHSNPGAWVAPLVTGSRRSRSSRSSRSSSSIARIWRRLAPSREFRLAFADRVERHVRRGALRDEASIERFRALQSRLDRAIVAESARWGDSAFGTESEPRTRESHWLPNCRAIERLMRGNADRFVRALRREKLFPSIDAPSLPLASALSAGAKLSIPAPPRGRVLYTTDGSDPRRPGSGAPHPAAREYDPAQPISLERTTRVRARVLAGSEWSALADALYTIGTERLPLRVSEIMVRPDTSSCEFIEIVNPSRAPIELDGLYLRGVRYWFPPGGELAAGASLVLIPDDDPDEFRRRYPETNVYGTYRGHLSNAGETLSLVDLDGVTLDSVSFGRDDPSQRSVEPNRSLEREWTSNVEAASWRTSSTAGGTPGTWTPKTP